MTFGTLVYLETISIVLMHTIISLTLAPDFFLMFWRKERRLCLYCQNENEDYVYIGKLILPKNIVYEHLSALII